MSNRKLLILGLGNPLMGDDGVGIQVVNELQNTNLSEKVDIMDGGTAGIDLIDMISGYERVIVVDAVRKGFSDENKEFSLHDVELTSVLRLMQTLGMDIPEITIIGIPAANITPRIGLSEECRKWIPEAVKLITEATGG
ncbi:MAG: hydrogenase maturation protease [Nitrospirae bacterium]|nr:hydrogenase maturation protease [Nitrospirota bacterium]